MYSYRGGGRRIELLVKMMKVDQIVLGQETGDGRTGRVRRAVVRSTADERRRWSRG